jgi:hypothetical protein
MTCINTGYKMLKGLSTKASKMERVVLVIQKDMAAATKANEAKKFCDALQEASCKAGKMTFPRLGSGGNSRSKVAQVTHCSKPLSNSGIPKSVVPVVLESQLLLRKRLLADLVDPPLDARGADGLPLAPLTRTLLSHPGRLVEVGFIPHYEPQKFALLAEGLSIWLFALDHSFCSK